MVWILAPWLAWCIFCLAGLLLVPLVHKPRGNAYTNGLVVYVCPTLAEKLTPRELAAVVAHEHGHRARGHAWFNLARSCVFVRSNPAREWRQECEADDYAAARGYRLELASALRKMSYRARDRGRGARLLDAHWAARRLRLKDAQHGLGQRA